MATVLQEFKSMMSVGNMVTCEAYSDGMRVGVENIPRPTTRNPEDVAAYNAAVLALPVLDNVKVWETTGPVSIVRATQFARRIVNRRGEEVDSWSEWPKARELRKDETGAFIVEDGDGHRRRYFLAE